MVFLISCFCYSACLGAKAPGALVCTLNGRDASWLLAMGLALWCDNQAHKRLVVLGCVVGAWWWCLENAQWITQSLWSLVTRNENRWHVSVNITLDSFWSTARTESLASALPLWSSSEGMGTSVKTGTALWAQPPHCDALLSFARSSQWPPVSPHVHLLEFFLYYFPMPLVAHSPHHRLSPVPPFHTWAPFPSGVSAG